MLKANKAIRNNEVVNIYEITVDDFKEIKSIAEAVLDKLKNIKTQSLFDDRTLTYLKSYMEILVDYFHFTGI